METATIAVIASNTPWRIASAEEGAQIAEARYIAGMMKTIQLLVIMGSRCEGYSTIPPTK